MNFIEKAVYDAVKRHPALKWAVRNAYQRIFDLVPVRSCISPYPITAREGFFFGFHDHTPFSPSGKMMAANQYHIPLRMPRLEDDLGVGVFSGNSYNSFRSVARTRAWNWHQGCKLQWRGVSDVLVFNDHQQGQNVARMIDVETGSETMLPAPVASISGDGQWAVGYSFERLNRFMPGYGYEFAAGDPDLRVERPGKSGLYRINLNNQQVETILAVKEMASLKPEPSMEGAFHYFTHAIFAPSTHRFVFLHRWTQDDLRLQGARMISCDVDGRNPYVFPTHEMVSHIGWKDANHVLAYCRLKGVGDRYVLFKDQDESVFEVIGEESFNSDGHPSYSPDRRWIVTDTYPDRTRRCYLALYDTAQRRRHNLALLKAPREFATLDVHKHWRCDLHPRWDRTGRFLSFDSTHTGKRALCTIDLGAPIAEAKNVLSL